MPCMAVASMCDTKTGMCVAFPDWKNDLKFIDGEGGNVIRAQTKQLLGKPVRDIPAMGPFPAVAFADMSEYGRTTACILPWETGVYTFEGDLLVSIGYPEGMELEEVPGETTTMHLKPSPVGFPSIFSHVGCPLGPPPAP